MSGVKCAQARLDAENRRQLEAEFAQSRQMAADLARMANVGAQAERLTAELERQLASGVIGEGFRQKLEDFRANAGRLREGQAEVRGCLDTIATTQAAGTSDPVAALAEVAGLRRRAGELLASLAPAAAAVEAGLADIEDGLAREQRSEDYRARAEDARVRRELAGLREELDTRLHPGGECSLASVAGPARALRVEIEALLSTTGLVSAADGARCRRELGSLCARAEVIEQESRERWAIFARWDRAFRDAGFQRVDTPEVAAPDAVLTARHVANTSRLRAIVDSAVRSGGHIDIYMRGPSGEGHRLLGPAEHCPESLAEVIAMAERLGLVIENVLWKGGPGGSWTALDLPGADRPGGKKRKEEQQWLQAKPQNQ